MTFHFWAWPIIAALLCVIRVCYNIWFHPLIGFPGPKIAAASRLWYTAKVLGGHHKYAIKQLHDLYGPVVRIAPNELSYIDSRAWRDIYGKLAHENGAAALEKEPDFFAPAFNSSDTLVDASSRDFKPQKKNATRAFSHNSLVLRGSAMALQIDRGIENLKSYLQGTKGQKINIEPWVGNMVLDIHSRLTMSHDFAATDLGPKLHPIVSKMHSAVTVIQYCTQLQYLPKFLISLPKLLPQKDIFTVLGNIPPLGPAITARLAKAEHSTEAHDFVSHMMGDGKNSAAEMATLRKNSLIFILSGVETVPGYICSVLYYLLEAPAYFKAASAEVRSRFATSEDITLGSVQSLAFLNAAMREALRVSPPAVGTLPRRVPSVGSVICDQYVPSLLMVRTLKGTLCG